MLKSFFLFFLPTILFSQTNYQSDFGTKNGCFLVRSVKTGKILTHYNLDRCKETYPPCSTFKIPLAFMAFQSGFFIDSNTNLKWDGTINRRKSLNKNQTPSTYLQHSVNWVSNLIIEKLGTNKVNEYLKNYSYGKSNLIQNDWNLKNSKIKISGFEQTQFFSRLWQSKLGDKKSLELLKSIMGKKHITKDTIVYGKTGSCCLEKNCEKGPGKQFGWYVGILEKSSDSYAFSLNYSDTVPSKGYAGANARKLALSFLKNL